MQTETIGASHSLATCQHCGGIHVTSQCPRVKAIEYHKNGRVKRVEFYEEPKAWPTWIVSPWP